MTNPFRETQVTVAEAAVILGITRQRVHQLIDEGTLHVRGTLGGLAGGTIYFLSKIEVYRLARDRREAKR